MQTLRPVQPQATPAGRNAGRFRTPARPALPQEPAEARYRRMIPILLHDGAELAGTPAGERDAGWEEAFALHRRRLASISRLGAELRPIASRDRQEHLEDEALVGEILEMFSA